MDFWKDFAAAGLRDPQGQAATKREPPKAEPHVKSGKVKQLGEDYRDAGLPHR